MKLKNIKNQLLKKNGLSLGFLLLAIMAPVSISAKMMLPLPPQSNPNPPITQVDKARVAFAIDAVKLILMAQNQISQNNTTMMYIEGNLHPFNDKDLKCLKEISCYGADLNFMSELNALRINHGKVTQMQHAHIIPWSLQNFQKNRGAISKIENNIVLAEMIAQPPVANKPMKVPQLLNDEYMVHVYVKFENQPAWYHLDVILTEEAEGKIFLRHFFVAPIMAVMPPGVVC